jgi:hypothetical protein
VRSVLHLLWECEPWALLHSCSPALIGLLSTNAYSRKRMNQPEYVQEPEDDNDDHH